MFGYSAAKLSTEQVAARRKLLDQAGYQAYITPIILLVTLFIARRTFSSFPSNKAKATTGSKKPSQGQVITRRVSWLLNTTYISEFGPFHVQIIGLFYGTWLLYLVFSNTGNDYMHLAKAFGHVGVSQLPFHYLLAIKSPNSPITFATGLTHERLNSFHRLFGRVVHVILAAHAMMYLSFFRRMGILWKRMQDWDVRLGLMAFWSLNILAVLSIPPIRRKAYHAMFYKQHILLSIMLVLIIWMHVPYTRLYVAQAGIFWLVNGMGRKKSAEKVQPVCERIGSGLISVKIQATALRFAGFQPGMHVYLRDGLAGPRTPFTVLNIQESVKEDKVEIQLFAKDSGGPMTHQLGETATQKKSLDIYLEGPYGEAKEYMPGLLDAGIEAGKMLLVSGGIGTTYTLPIFKALVQARGSTSGLKLVIVVRSSEEAVWATNFVQEIATKADVSIYVTQKGPEHAANSAVATTRGRPDFEQLVDGFFAARTELGVSAAKQDPRRPKRSYETVTVMSCGPANLSKDLRRAIGKHVLEYGRDVRWFEEQFGFGGS